MLENLERFTNVGRNFKPKVSIRCRGQFGFNNGAINRFSIQKFNFAVLFISNDKNKIAIKLTNSENEDGAIKIMKRAGNYSFSGKSFLDFYSINYEKTKSYDAQWIDEDKAIVIEIKGK